ncbi:hypothetical protein A2U01_0092699, partial [Trifolium medium]|nr:hypothetical protein [Trifolium medium]
EKEGSKGMATVIPP